MVSTVGSQPEDNETRLICTAFPLRELDLRFMLLPRSTPVLQI